LIVCEPLHSRSQAPDFGVRSVEPIGNALEISLVPKPHPLVPKPQLGNALVREALASPDEKWLESWGFEYRCVPKLGLGNEGMGLGNEGDELKIPVIDYEEDELDAEFKTALTLN
jgi:hypothetical protein